jgi:hypothetical protein
MVVDFLEGIVRLYMLDLLSGDIDDSKSFEYFHDQRDKMTLYL